ncbi:MAG TPA: zinc ribbon domain-containing protein [Methanoregulaceae archaeon]|nr:zinc ribbon domain-containing protein [Methanoregulaceae archaeon]
MDEPGMKNTMSGSDQYLKPGERLLKISDRVRIKKFTFTAYITDQRVFLIDKNEKKPGITSKEIPRDVIISSILESADIDPFLVLNIRTSADESRTMKIAFIEEGNDRTHEIEEWINILHGRPLRGPKPVSRHWEPPAPNQKSVPAKMKVPETKPSYEEPVPYKMEGNTAVLRRDHEIQVQPETPAGEPGVPQEITDQGHDSGEIQFCHHCGKKIPPGANFCPYCGTKLHRSKISPISRIKKRENQEDA